MTQIVLAVLVAVIAFCSYLMFDAMRLNAKRRQSMRERLAGGNESLLGETPEMFTPLAEEISPLAKVLTGLMRGFGINTQTVLKKLELNFARAGIASPNAPIYYLFSQRFLSPVFGLLGIYIFLGAEGKDELLLQMIGIIVGVLGVFGPKLYVKNKADKRNKLLLRAFPDTLDLLLICVESGLALDAALSRVCSELARAYPEMTSELNRTRLELALLNDRVRALLNLGERTGLVAFRSLVVALVQSERFGTSLTDTLRVLSEDFRLQRLSMAEAKAARLPVLLTIPLILLLMPAFMIVIMGPAIIGVIHLRNER